MALFEDTVLQSDNFVDGASGWQIAKNGDAQFNDLTVTGEMIQDGAVTRAFSHAAQVAGANTSRSIWVDTGIELSVNFLPRDLIDPSRTNEWSPAKNPVMMTLSVSAALTSGTSKAGLEFRVLGRPTGAASWSTLKRFEESLNRKASLEA